MLQSGDGGPLAPRAPRSGRGGRRTGLIAAGAVVGVGVLAGGAFAGYAMFFATGAQPAEALPDTTVGYVSVDLDPSGQQKLAALRTLEKFPAFTDNVDLDAEDDLRLRLFEQLQGEGLCADLDFADDIDPWLGNRFAAAAVDLGGDGTAGLGVTAVGVVQVDDAAAAEDGLAALQACSEGDDAFGWSVSGDWAVLAETTEAAEEVTAAAAESTLSDDDDFKKWTGEAGDPGILSAYVAPAAGSLLSEAVTDLAGLGAFAATDTTCVSPPYDPEDPFGGEGVEEFCEETSTLTPPEVTDELESMFDDFEGFAVTVRFDDGALEIESATGAAAAADGPTPTQAGDDALSTLPEDTAVALGLGLPEDWFAAVDDYADTFLGDGGLDSFLSQAEAETGLDLPDDIETLLGESVAVALGGGADLTAFNESEPPSDLELGVKVAGDSGAITDVIDRLLAAAGDDELDTLLGYESDDEFVVAGPSADYREALLEDGGLGDTDAYRDAVLNSEDAGAVLFVNFDAGSWLTSLPDLPADVQDNLDPLGALGVSGWYDDGVAHFGLRITTE